MEQADVKFWLDIIFIKVSYWNVEIVKLVLQVGTTIASLITLIIAIKAFKNFDVKKTFLKEQLKVVYDLSNDLNDFGLRTVCVSAGQASTHPRFLNFFKLDGLEKYRFIYFTTPYIEEILPFMKYQRNILLPNSIALVIKSFDKGYINGTPFNDLPNKYILLQSDMTPAEFSKLNHYHYYIEYDEFKEMSIQLVIEINIWLKKYGAMDINLPKHMVKK